MRFFKLVEPSFILFSQTQLKTPSASARNGNILLKFFISRPIPIMANATAIFVFTVSFPAKRKGNGANPSHSRTVALGRAITRNTPSRAK